MSLKELSSSTRDAFLIELENIKPGENVRGDFSTVPDLAISLFNMGQLVPLVVRMGEDGKTAVICDGERRYRAAKYVNEHYVTKETKDKKITHLLCVSEPRGMNELDRILRQLETNDQSVPLTMMERARAYKKLILAGWKPTEIAGKVGKSVTAINNVLAILEAPKELQDGVEKGHVSPSAASKATKASPKKKEAAIKKAVAGEKVTVSDVDENGVLSAVEIRKMIKKANGFKFASKSGTQEYSRWEGVAWAFEVVLGMHEFN